MQSESLVCVCVHAVSKFNCLEFGNERSLPNWVCCCLREKYQIVMDENWSAISKFYGLESGKGRSVSTGLLLFGSLFFRPKYTV